MLAEVAPLYRWMNKCAGLGVRVSAHAGSHAAVCCRSPARVPIHLLDCVDADARGALNGQPAVAYEIFARARVLPHPFVHRRFLIQFVALLLSLVPSSGALPVTLAAAAATATAAAASLLCWNISLVMQASADVGTGKHGQP